MLLKNLLFLFSVCLVLGNEEFSILLKDSFRPPLTKLHVRPHVLSTFRDQERVTLCYGILYGTVSLPPVQFFVDYYLKVGVEKVVAYLHPNLESDLPQFEQIEGLSVSMWPTSYDHTVSSHRENHRLALGECIQNQLQSGISTILLCDLDEFLYFNLEKYSSLQNFLRHFRKEGYSQISLAQVYYEVDLCVQKNDNLTIWDSPYRTGMVPSATKALFFTDQYLGMLSHHSAHAVNVSGDTILLDADEGHFKHYRRFPVWNGECQVITEPKYRYHEKEDRNDPGKKKRFSKRFYNFERDFGLPGWEKFIERNQHR